MSVAERTAVFGTHRNIFISGLTMGQTDGFNLKNLARVHPLDKVLDLQGESLGIEFRHATHGLSSSGAPAASGLQRICVPWNLERRVPEQLTRRAPDRPQCARHSEWQCTAAQSPPQLVRFPISGSAQL
jgi:hypothetical protein